MDDFMLTLQELEKTQELFDATPKDKMKVFNNPTLWLASDHNVIKSWTNTQPFYFYPFSVLDFLNSPERQELRIISANSLITSRTIQQFRNSKVHFEGLNPDLMSKALELGCKTSVICNLREINEDNLDILSHMDLLTVRVNSSDSDISVLKGISDKKLLSGIRIYLSASGNDFSSLAKKAKQMGLDFIHVSKRLIGSAQISLSEYESNMIKKLSHLQSEKFKILLPTNTETVYNEKFVISDEYNNSRNCYFSRYRIVLYGNKFYPCYTRSIIEKGKFSSDNPGDLKKKSHLFGKECSDCACIYENDLFDEISRVSKGVKNKKFFLGYSIDK